MLYTVAIAVCLSAVSASDCREPTAVSWIIAPEAQGSATGCMVHGMQYAAMSHLVTAGSYAKIFCSPHAPRQHAEITVGD